MQETAQGDVLVHFNRIVDLAELHYGSSNEPQRVIDGRLVETLTRAVERADQDAGDWDDS